MPALSEGGEAPKVTLPSRLYPGVPVVAQWVTNPTSIHEDAVQSLAPLSGLRIWCCCGCGVGWRLQLSFDPYRELPYATGTTLKKKEDCIQPRRIFPPKMVVLLAEEKEVGPGQAHLIDAPYTWFNGLVRNMAPVTS